MDGKKIMTKAKLEVGETLVERKRSRHLLGKLELEGEMESDKVGGEIGPSVGSNLHKDSEFSRNEIGNGIFRRVGGDDILVEV